MFINLHLHTNFSWDSVSQISDIISFIKESGQTAVAITDHGNMSGCVEFHQKCIRAGLKPILGIEAYVCRPSFRAADKNSDNKVLNHLVILAKNYNGYLNLLKLVKLSNQNFYYKPRIDEEMLFAHSDGLIVLNGHHTTSLFDCLFFNLNAVYECDDIECARQYLYPDYEERCLELIERYKNVFGDDFYVEVQLFDRGDICQQTAGKVLYELAQKHSINVVGTGDAHYIKADDAVIHRTFCAIKQNSKVADLSNIRYYTSGNYGIITNEWAERCYPQDLIDSTVRVASKIECFDITKPAAIPKFPIKNPRSHIKDLCEKKLKELELNEQIYLDRLNYELEILEMGDLYNYFLIVADYINWAKSQKILTGVGRGSGAGSLVGFLMGITGIDPLIYNLSFDRFYSPDRAAQKILPDYDTDFPASRRDEVISYIRSKYGNDRVAGVVTFSTLQGKNALKDVLRVYSACSFSEMNKITEYIPSRDAISDKLADFKEETGSSSIIEYCLRKEPDLLRDWCYIDEHNNYCGDLAKYFEIAIKLEGAIKSESKHASAIIIGAESIVNLAPLLRDKSSDELLVGLDMDSFEKVSLVKFDILGIKSLDCLMEINNLIKEIGIDVYEPALAN